MIVFAWFTLLGLIVLFSFGFISVTFWHWYKEAQKKKKTQAATRASESSPS
ncbi:MAG: hypothetical protein HUU57_16085 [Bdellovibrio sp.]|nr:hypothetical protein [Bdellovibrio sp.]